MTYFNIQHLFTHITWACNFRKPCSCGLLNRRCTSWNVKSPSTGLMHSSSTSFEWMDFKGSKAPCLKSRIIIWDLNLLLTVHKWRPDHNLLGLISKEKAPTFAAWDLWYWHFRLFMYNLLCIWHLNVSITEEHGKKGGGCEMIAQDDQRWEEHKGRWLWQTV